nr:multicopper oxidase family protein [Rubrivirga marina]
MPTRSTTDRRTFLRSGTAALAGLAVGGPLLAGCRDADRAAAALPARRPVADGPAREVRLVAGPVEVELAPGRVWRTWGYNGQYPGPEIRVREGERLRVTVENDLPGVGTTVHWHGVPVPNPMDGVPGLTQEPIPPGGRTVYEFEATPSGSYMYHSHQGLQLDRGLLGPLVVEETTPHVEYDREHVLVLDDVLMDAPRPLSELVEDGDGGMGMMGRGGMMGRMRGRDRGQGGGRERGGGMMDGMTGGVVPPYAGLAVNGRLPEAPAEFEVRRGERVRLRLINPGGATTYRVAMGGHRMTVTHTDGRPVEPVTVDRLTIGMGERYDVVVEADNPGVWPLVAATVEGDSAPARAVLRYAGAAGSSLRDGLPEGLQGGRALRYGDLQSVETLPAEGAPDRTFDLRLSGGMMMAPDVWTMGGEAYPDAAPLEVREGERVRVDMSNMSMMLHPMHLHGHFFRTGNVLKDTVQVAPHMGRASFEFVADNPGRWFFHCHNLYHLHAGMAREVRYV